MSIIPIIANMTKLRIFSPHDIGGGLCPPPYWGHGDLNSDVQVSRLVCLRACGGGIWSLPRYQVACPPERSLRHNPASSHPGRWRSGCVHTLRWRLFIN